MSFPLLTNARVTVIPVASTVTRDRYHNPVQVPDEGTEYDAWLEQTTAQELTIGRETVVSDWLVLLPPAAEGIDGTDQVLDADGRTFQVVGAPALIRTRRGLDHVEARLRLVEG